MGYDNMGSAGKYTVWGELISSRQLLDNAEGKGGNSEVKYGTL